MAIGGTVVESFKDGRFEFMKLLIKCGKGNCSKCPHGPYWYVRYWVGRRCKKVYVGKELSGWMEKKGITLLARLGRIKEREDREIDQNEASADLLGAQEVRGDDRS